MNTGTAPERESERDAGHDEIHLVPMATAGNGIARCGFDCSGRTEKHGVIATCVICRDLAGFDN